MNDVMNRAVNLFRHSGRATGAIRNPGASDVLFAPGFRALASRAPGITYVCCWARSGPSRVVLIVAQ